MEKIKLMKAHWRVVHLLKKGWHLGKSNNYYWLQEDGLGNGGRTEEVNIKTFNFLYDEQLIIKMIRTENEYTLRDAATYLEEKDFFAARNRRAFYKSDNPFSKNVKNLTV